MKTLDLRTRVAATFAIACIAVVAALAITLNSAWEDLEEGLVDQIVSEEMDFLVRHYREFPSLARDSGPNLQYYVVRCPEDLAEVPEKLRGLPPGMHEVGHGINEQHVAVRIVDGIRFIVAYDAGPHELREQEFKRLVLFALAIIMVVAAALGYWIAGLLTRQITSLATRVAALEPGVPRAPLAQQGQDAEVAALAHAFDQYEDRIRELIEREQEFTGNASHELRTPLTAIRTSCELLLADTALQDKARTRITAIAAAAERMTGQIELLLFLARAEPMAARESIRLADCVNAAVEPWLAEIKRKALHFNNTIVAGATVTANPQALNLVLANLLRNAVQYTMTGGIRVEWTAPILTISDTGPGVAPEQRALLFERHYRGADSNGFGLGLAIVKRACDHCHWHIEVTTPAGGGTAFRLTLA